MALLAVPVTIAVALALVPLLVKVLDRNAGWPLGLTFLALAGYVINHARPILDGDPATWSATWVDNFPTPGTSIEFALTMDPLGLFFTLLALTIGAVVFIYSTRYLHHGTKVLSFYLLMTAFMLAVLLLVLTDDVALLFIGWELVSLASFFLIARSGSGGEAGSIRTLLLTFIGGLLLAAALMLMVAVTGTMRVSEIIDSPAWDANTTALTIAAILIALAGFSKAAQIPFHFWLPEAMAADTPVSAFLHAAAVVKAGVYLLMRFSGLFAGVQAWHVLLIVTGMTTAIMAAVFAIQKTDLKKLTAYSTVSQLGWIVATIGVGTPFALAAALVHTAAHALFKSSLFMLVGVVDHQAGSRDIRRLGRLYKRMPFTFISAVVAAASMAAIPPTFGFVSKEGMLTAFEDAPLNSFGVVVLLAGAAVGALATFIYSARYVFGAFIDGPKDMSDVKEASPSLWVPAAIPGLLSLPVVLFMSRFDSPIDGVTESTGIGEAHTHLALWHGINVPLLISVGVLILGTAIVFARKKLITPLEGKKLGVATGAEMIRGFVNLCVRLGRLVATPANSISPYRHVVWIFGGLVTLGAFAILGPGRMEGIQQLEPRVSGIDRPTDLISLVIISLAVVSLVSTRSRLASVALVSVVGVAVSWQMLTLGAPDVATTQLLVEFAVIVLMMLVVRHQPRLYLKEGDNRTRFATVLAVVVALVTFFGVWLLLGRHDKPQIAQWYLENTPEITGSNNVVALILVEFRALDTLGELMVLGMAGIVIAAIIKSIPRSPLPGYGPGSTSELFRAPGSNRFADVHKVPELAPFYSKYLRSTHLNSIPARMTTYPLVPILVILSAVTFWRGHQAPGGGFVAALIAACGLLFYYVGKAQATKIGSDQMGYSFVGLGVAIALITGLVGYSKGSFLAPLHGYIGDIHVTTSIVFDVGVYMAVLGLILIVINQMGGRDRPGADPAEYIAEYRATRTPSKKGKKGAPVEHHESAHQPSPVAVTAGGSHVPLNPSQVSAEEKKIAEMHRLERESARRPAPEGDDERLGSDAVATKNNEKEDDQ
ncbi:MAG TPA: DUF4040 family protein [Candidatus Corynebacterium gallistercoris]|uniref:DUF4040 family protein n=1 Tax=Candidatus Corynebacterium gallistercoris TaxID=2838530 RepID=A0A9D1RWD1_9CORY|nr:DUF4040 family protein [Candidatus Corynebacterium gallistercoris]